VATVTTEVTQELRTLTAMVRRMFPHERFPDGPYERCAAAIRDAAQADVRTKAQLEEGLRALVARRFGDMDADAAMACLKEISGSSFFAFVQSTVVTTLYDDHEVWALLGYEAGSFAKGGWVDRGFNDLDWLPEPRIEEASS
jgi:hypothetical protein